MFDKLFGAFIAFILLAIVAMTALVIYADMTAEHISIRKDKWQCTQQRQENSIMVVSTGKTTTTIPTVHTVCSQYTKRM